MNVLYPENITKKMLAMHKFLCWETNSTDWKIALMNKKFTQGGSILMAIDSREFQGLSVERKALALVKQAVNPLAT